jgi:hypothetical protein
METCLKKNMAVVCVVAPCSLVEVYRRFRGALWLWQKDHIKLRWTYTRLHGATQKAAIFILAAVKTWNFTVSKSSDPLEFSYKQLLLNMKPHSFLHQKGRDRCSSSKHRLGWRIITVWSCRYNMQHEGSGGIMAKRSGQLPQVQMRGGGDRKHSRNVLKWKKNTILSLRKELQTANVLLTKITLPSIPR